MTIEPESRRAFGFQFLFPGMVPRLVPKWLFCLVCWWHYLSLTEISSQCLLWCIYVWVWSLMDPIYFVGRCLDLLHRPCLFSLVSLILCEWSSQAPFDTVIKFFTVLYHVTRVFTVLTYVSNVKAFRLNLWLEQVLGLYPNMDYPLFELGFALSLYVEVGLGSCWFLLTHRPDLM